MGIVSVGSRAAWLTLCRFSDTTSVTSGAAQRLVQAEARSGCARDFGCPRGRPLVAPGSEPIQTLRPFCPYSAAILCCHFSRSPADSSLFFGPTLTASTRFAATSARFLVLQPPVRRPRRCQTVREGAKAPRGSRSAPPGKIPFMCFFNNILSWNWSVWQQPTEPDGRTLSTCQSRQIDNTHFLVQKRNWNTHTTWRVTRWMNEWLMCVCAMCALMEMQSLDGSSTAVCF